jgi:hypothetical protein
MKYEFDKIIPIVMTELTQQTVHAMNRSIQTGVKINSNKIITGLIDRQ